MTASLWLRFGAWRDSLAAGWGRLGRWKQVVLGVVVAGPLAIWAALAPGPLVVFIFAACVLILLVRRARLSKREGRLVMGVLVLAILLRFLAGAAHYYYASSHGMGVDVFPDARTYSSMGHFMAENLWGFFRGEHQQWLSVDKEDPGRLEYLRKTFGRTLPWYTAKGLIAYGYFVGIVYTLFGLSPISIKWIQGLVGVLLAWAIYRFLRLEGFRQSAPVALVLTAFFPSLFLWSVSGLRETFVIFLCIVLLGVYVRSDSTRRASLATAALGYLVFRQWVVVITGIALLVKFFTRKIAGDRQWWLPSGKIIKDRWAAERDSSFDAGEIEAGRERTKEDGLTDRHTIQGFPRDGENRITRGTELSADVERLEEDIITIDFWCLFIGSVGITMLGDLRWHVGLLLAIVYVLSFLLFRAKELVFSLGRSWLRFFYYSRVNAILLLVLIMVGAGWIGQRSLKSPISFKEFTGIIYTQRARTENALTPIFIYPKRFYEADIRTLERKYVKDLLPKELLTSASKGLVYTLFAPFPSARGKWLHRAASAQMVFIYGLYLLASVGVVMSYRRAGWRHGPIWILVGLYLFLIGLVEGNVGTLIRHRDLVTPILLAAAAVGMIDVARWFQVLEGKRSNSSAPAPSDLLWNLSGWESDTDVSASYESAVGSPELMPSVLYVSYNSLIEPVFQSQALAYMKKLAQRGITFNLITFEKPDRALPPHNLGGLTKQLNANGIRCFPRRYHKRPHLISTLYDQMIGAIACAWHLATKPIDLVHARGVTPAAMVLIPARLFRCPIVFDMRSSLAEAYTDAGVWKGGGPWYRLVRRMETLAARKAEKVVVETEAHRRILLKSLDDPALADKVEVIPCCVDLERFARVSSAGEDEPWELVYLGSLSGWYKFEEMVAFYKLARESWGAGRMAFLTDGPAEDVRRWVAQEGLPVEEVIIESLPFADVPGRLARAQAGIVFTEPGRRLESLPVKVGEYLAAGLPLVVSSGMGDTEQLVRSQGVGVVVESFAEEGYRQAASELKALYVSDGSLARRCREVARTRLSLETGAERYWALYQSVGDGAGEHQPLPGRSRRA